MRRIPPGSDPADPGASPLLPTRPRDGVFGRALPASGFDPGFQIALEVDHAARANLHKLGAAALDPEDFKGMAAAAEERRGLLGGEVGALHRSALGGDDGHLGHMRTPAWCGRPLVPPAH